MNITIVAGARPNFIKIAPILKAIEKARGQGAEIAYRLVHTGQHYDKKMSGDFFSQLQIPSPDVNLEAGGGTQAEQTANIMVRFEGELIKNRPDMVIVVGDVTSTMACTIAAKKLCIDVAHVEGGIRSGDRSMPEEINRLVTDSITDYFFTTSEVANENLRTQGIPESKIFFVGNTMIDTLKAFSDKLIKPEVWKEKELASGKYFVLTLHRPANVDDRDKLESILREIISCARGYPIVFPVHPRTAKMLDGLGVSDSNLILTEPLSYLEFNYLVKNAKAVITDSGGITEEATVLHIPCITLRDTTERPETVTLGTNILAGAGATSLKGHFETLFADKWKKGTTPPLWDGKASERIVQALLEIYH